ncbi:hypothetical protein ACFC06_16630 [Nocardia sp. NPDC056064]|uniref:hypothetical protein n=1 Tax=Nocardia sp. NPDC056064 TaxID=3345701 RepID=UPI0035DD93D5
MEFVDEMWRYGPEMCEDIARNPDYGQMIREALDFVITRGTTTGEWHSRTHVWFERQEDLDEYLRAFSQYLFGDRDEPIPPPDYD